LKQLHSAGKESTFIEPQQLSLGSIPFDNVTKDVRSNNITRAKNYSAVSEILACLRKVPIDSLNAVLNSSVTASVPYWGLVVDNDFAIATSPLPLAPCHELTVFP